MITAHLDFSCILCGQKQSWYIYPLSEKTKSGDYINSVNRYKLGCKKCGYNYILEFTIKPIKHQKKRNNEKKK